MMLGLLGMAVMFSGCEMKKPAESTMDGMKCQAGKCETGKCQGAPKKTMKCQTGKCGGN